MHLAFGSSGHNGHPDNLVEGQYFRAKRPGRKSLVVVMPIWGTSSYPPAKISTGYARRAGNDTHVIWIYGNAPVFPWDELSSVPTEDGFRALARDSAERYRSAVSTCAASSIGRRTQPEIDASRIAFVGFSMSALVTATLLANEPRVSAGVLMMGAARFADIFSMCRNRAGDVREHALRTLRLDGRPVPRVLQGLVRSCRSRALRGPLRSRQDPDDRRDVRRLHAGVVARRAVGNHGPPASASRFSISTAARSTR